MSEQNKRSWKNFLVNPQFQLRYTFFNSFLGLVLIIIYALIFYFYINENYQLLVEMVDMDNSAQKQLYTELYQIIMTMAGVSILFIGIAALIGVFISHKVAGPLYKFKSVLKEIEETGDTSKRVYFRPGDEFQDLAQAFNKMMDKIEKK